ncbi:MAG: NmrA family transcriptional regulator [Mesorhizobium sp.]|uniref:NAD(P)H-binding protein n=1 Tax=Mesorhizobium sp. TaxID=1871066 RepID=UPI001205F792|nr:NAD(P)H-binding protein [Mesorhizobium sp.]TIO47400.1 MAG: NmrA family transcriptional regulator [Mesorhizobium sp.]TIO56881.1 MAG: NmrA family transcriptional regulator [Mesorhizobium sp.]TJV58514.1 MAG: NmrA family transcriptional regulator [Mesorhizobium sp.]
MKMFVILGATGKIGRATIGMLRQNGLPVRAVVRNPSKAHELRACGCDIAVADLRDMPALVEATKDASAVQVICPTLVQAENASAEMAATIGAIAEALRQTRPARILAISDYGAQLPTGTGITLTFHHLESELKKLPAALTFLRSAEHMQNWGRGTGRALQTGVLASLHHPVSKTFPTVSAGDVGLIAADLLLADRNDAMRIVHAEGPRRYSAVDVADALSKIAGREIVAREMPRQDWISVLVAGGMSASYAQLVADLFDVHNAGQIDAEQGVGEIRYGKTELRAALSALVPSTLTAKV